MKHRLSDNIRNLFAVVGANLFVMIVGVIQSFIFPKLMGPAQYGYWSLYLLYVGYAGFFNLGVSDGIYLIYGGKTYKDLEKDKFKSYLNIVIFYLLIFLICWSLYFIYFGKNTHHIIIMLLVGGSSFLACLINFVTMIDQATARFAIYSKGHVIEKIAIMCGAIGLLVWHDALVAILASIVGRVFTVIYYYYYAKPILCTKHAPYKETFKDVIRFGLVGIWMTLAAIGTTAMTGIGRFFIQNELGVTQLGYYSFVLSISGLFTIFFSAIATVLFPMMKRSTCETYQKQINMLDGVLDLMGVLILFLYHPAKMVLSVLYPQYQPAFNCLVVLFPLVLLQGRVSIIYFTMYKVERMEKRYVYSLFLAMILCIVFSWGSLKICAEITSVAIATYMAFVFWCILNVALYNKNTDFKFRLKYHISYILICIVFLVLNLMNVSEMIKISGTYIFLIPVALYVMKNSISSIKDIKKYLE